jgi:hypothetical protein
MQNQVIEAIQIADELRADHLPARFVLEFQKCLDQTEPVPFGKRGEALYAAPSHWSHANSG